MTSSQKIYEFHEIVSTVLKMDPTKIGVGRLCQELLAEVTGVELIPNPLYESLNLPGINMVNKGPIKKTRLVKPSSTG